MADDERRKWVDELPADIGPFKELLHEYSHILWEEVDAHIHKIRDQAYEIVPYPGFGLWGFTRVHLLAADPVFQLAASRLAAQGSRDALLDLGCGLGQNLRQLVRAGAPASRLFAADLRPGLWELGLELFGDRGAALGQAATFVVGDVLADADGDGDGDGGADGAGTALRALDGRMSMVHAANFFHLFSWEDQVRIGVRVTRFVRGQGGEGGGEAGAFVFGRHVGSLEPGDRSFASHQSEEQYLHDQASFQRLWDEVGEATGTKWRAEVEMLGKMPPGYGYLGEAARYCKFVVWRL